MRQIQRDILLKIAKMTDLGIFKWKKGEDQNLRWVKMKSIKMITSMEPEIDDLIIESENGVMIIRGGTPIIRTAITNAEMEIL